MPDMSHIAERFFSESECKLFRALPECQKREAFFNCWTRKEAYIKAIGDGLIMPLNSFDVTLIPGEPAKLINVPGDPENDINWSLHELMLLPGYIGAFAVEKGGWHLACWQWEWDEYWEGTTSNKVI
jgi:4'-phosphopantetheinyl transferase